MLVGFYHFLPYNLGMGQGMDGAYPLGPDTIAARKINYNRILFAVLYVVGFTVYLFLLYNSSSFYMTPFKERPHSTEYRALRPAGITGHGYGVVGSAMMILMLGYSLRKRVKLFRRWGMLSRWLDTHIYFGIMGPLLIVLHTAFKIQGLVAVSFWSMVIVTGSGIFGRYLYLQIPRNIQGDELDIKELEESSGQFTEELRKEYNLSEETIHRLEERESLKLPENAGAIRILMMVFANDAIRPFRFRRRQREYADLKHVSAGERKKIIRITHRKSLLTRRVLLLNQMQRLFHYWHVVHKPFAIIMYCIMVIHIVVAIWTGYRWVF